MEKKVYCYTFFGAVPVNGLSQLVQFIFLSFFMFCVHRFYINMLSIRLCKLGDYLYLIINIYVQFILKKDKKLKKKNEQTMKLIKCTKTMGVKNFKKKKYYMHM